MIKQTKEGWKVVASTGREMGTYDTLPEAQERLKQIEMFKHMRQRK